MYNSVSSAALNMCLLNSANFPLIKELKLNIFELTTPTVSLSKAAHAAPAQL